MKHLKNGVLIRIVFIDLYLSQFINDEIGLQTKIETMKQMKVKTYLKKRGERGNWICQVIFFLGKCR